MHYLVPGCTKTYDRQYSGHPTEEITGEHLLVQRLDHHAVDPTETHARPNSPTVSTSDDE